MLSLLAVLAAACNPISDEALLPVYPKRFDGFVHHPT
jgi:hypothetical protein